MSKVLLINGPNLGMLGKRQPQLYGYETLSDITEKLRAYASQQSVTLCDFQSNSEGDLVSFLNQQFLNLDQESIAGIIINPGAYTHTSIAIRDALEVFCDLKIPIFEVHLSNIFSRESFRHTSYVSSIATGVICGLGAFGYEVALGRVLGISFSGFPPLRG